eukprot:CAMPEP_0175983002 /NCGR_PEP_ID=MMETSP0108-20121206/48216_1 /TAXON_ID=195067 ORGANISM="Goniomonas pacifica, Strain CCMP1869" /NCGR_SAMPLE_ID=MMETSP0108 /ASSEMBLY_ACC=CAM_ASM_000204 /LENGTH=126 /DNA_ID=CAMNT_0017313729 /DNA_START=160 /DNA_END=539 /DNA_ORIENTATION=+
MTTSQCRRHHNNDNITNVTTTTSQRHTPTTTSGGVGARVGGAHLAVAPHNIACTIRSPTDEVCSSSDWADPSGSSSSSSGASALSGSVPAEGEMMPVPVAVKNLEEEAVGLGLASPLSGWKRQART